MEKNSDKKKSTISHNDGISNKFHTDFPSNIFSHHIVIPLMKSKETFNIDDS